MVFNRCSEKKQIAGCMRSLFLTVAFPISRNAASLVLQWEKFSKRVQRSVISSMSPGVQSPRDRDFLSKLRTSELTEAGLLGLEDH